jgi:hypothetical protein
MVTIQINDNTQSAKNLVKILSTLPFVKIEEQPTYNPDFVKKVLKSAKGKRTVIDPNFLWESI